MGGGGFVAARKQPDPARTLALLWRTREPASRKGKPALTGAGIAACAIGIADAEGLAALSMRRVAESLGVGTMSLYTYVPGKSELVDLMLDTVNGETDRTPPEPGQWRAHLDAVARQNYALHQRHRWMLHVPTQRALLGPGAMAKYEHELGGIDGIGLTDVEMDSVLNLVLGHAHGAARASAETTDIERDTGMDDAQWWDAQGPALEAVVDQRRYPTACRVGRAAGETHQASFNATHHFEFGLTRILDGIEHLIDNRRDAGSPAGHTATGAEMRG